MDIVLHNITNIKIAEIVADGMLISTTDDGLQLLGDVYYQGYDAIILQEKNISTHFFELKTGIAGEILQKFSNYRMRLAIVGDFTLYTSMSFSDFKRESNRLKHISFVSSIEEALTVLSS